VSATCRGCGRPIEWVQTDDGKKVPLDLAAPIYEGRDGALVRARLWPVEERRVMGPAVSHFATCAKAGDFGSGGRGVVEAVNYCAREKLRVDFFRGLVVVAGETLGIRAEGESFEEAVAQYISRRAAAQRGALWRSGGSGTTTAA
jgi:hypothetical protein